MNASAGLGCEAVPALKIFDGRIAAPIIIIENCAEAGIRFIRMNAAVIQTGLALIGAVVGTSRGFAVIAGGDAGAERIIASILPIVVVIIIVVVAIAIVVVIIARRVISIIWHSINRVLRVPSIFAILYKIIIAPRGVAHKIFAVAAGVVGKAGRGINFLAVNNFIIRTI